MMSKEKEKLIELKSSIEALLEKDYETFSEDGKKWYMISENCIVHIDMILGENFDCLVPEFTASKDTLCIAEDGELYYPKDFQTDEEMIKKCVDDIKNEAE